MTKRQITASEVAPVYARFPGKCAEARQRLQRPLTLAEKILFSHLHHWNQGEKHPLRGSSHVFLLPDRVAMQDATAQMAMLQFMQAGLDKVYVPATVHCDHLIQAKSGARIDLLSALDTNAEVYDFLRTASTKYGVGFWEPGAGIIHQVVLENYAVPGTLVIGTDSHTPNGGGLGMLAVGVGGADAVFTMAGEPWGLKWPKLIGVKLTGSLNGWAAPKDVILKLAGILTVQGGTGAIVEYFGAGARTISATGKATICNMGAELGATTSVFPLDEHMLAYLRLTGRGEIADLASRNAEHLVADEAVEQEPEKYFDQVIEIDLDKLEPHIVGPHTPDLARPISVFKAEVLEKGYPSDLRFALIGSCTNSSYEDMSRAAAVARQAAAFGIKAPIGFMVTPGSEQIHQTITRDGQLSDLMAVGAQVLANACGPCIGQWQRSDIKDGQSNSIITSFNRNFPRRNDGNASTLAFIASPEIVTALALTGNLAFNPLTDTIALPDGRQVMLTPPPAANLPEKGFSNVDSGFIDPEEAAKKGTVTVAISPSSTRLEALAPFARWDGKDLVAMPVLLKATGKCTTDHISPAGSWLTFRGHLDRISTNMFMGANNAFSSESGKGLNVLSGETASLSQVARDYKAKGLSWMVVGDHNYGEGSSREHAAMSPRFLGCRVVLARSFARIHETNLKQQGILALTFANPDDYTSIEASDRVTIEGLDSLAFGKPVLVKLVKQDGSTGEISCHHTMTEEQIGWFKCGSALNLVGERRKQEALAGKATRKVVPNHAGRANTRSAMKKVTIIGAGNVGAATAQDLALRSVADVVMLDIAEGVARGKALDLSQAVALAGGCAKVSGTGNYEDTRGSDVIVITAGSPRKPGMTREQLLEINSAIVAKAATESFKYSPKARFVVVSNPLDVMTYLVGKVTGLRARRVLGMAGVLDSARFQSFIAEELKVSPADVRAMVLGGHGDLMVPLPRFSTVNGIPITELLSKKRIEALCKRTINGGVEIVDLLKTGSAFYAPGIATSLMVEAILKGSRRLLPCSVFSEGKYGLPPVYLGLPVIVGKRGVERIVNLKLTDDELKALKASAESIASNVALLKS